jgi:hypothetical protein
MLMRFTPILLTMFLGILMVSPQGCNDQGGEAYLFSYFTGNGEDGLHLAFSRDALNWTVLNGGRSILEPEAGVDRLMRDPCIIRGGDGRFHMVWTVSWNEQGIGYSSSEDLIHWSGQQYIPVMEHEPEARNCWAPELFYDDLEERYMIYWSTTIPGKYPVTDSTGDNGYNHRIYYTATTDFMEFSDTRLLYDHGFNVIDATITSYGDEYVMFLKDETRWPEPEKNIRIARSPTLTGGYSAPTEAITDHWVEGPTVIRTHPGWILYFDRYREHEMGALLSDDLEAWTDISDSISFPEGTRHGTVLRITGKELDRLLEAFTPSVRP